MHKHIDAHAAGQKIEYALEIDMVFVWKVIERDENLQPGYQFM